MTSNIKYDFGKKKRQALRRFRQLLNLDVLQEADIRQNPVPYLERASELMYQLENALRDAADAAKPPLGSGLAVEQVEVDKSEYNRLLACRAIVDAALTAYLSEQEE